MKTLSFLLAAALVSTAYAQTAPPTSPNPTPSQAKAIRTKTAAHRVEAYEGPKVVRNGEELGQKMMQKSKPADMIRMRPQPALPK